MTEKKEEKDEKDQLQQITTGDPNAVKQLLDDYASRVVLDGYTENKQLEYVKLIFMVAACIVACIAQFYEKFDTAWEFPVNRGLLFICCSLYFIFSGILQYILSFMEEDIILITNPKEGLATSSGLRLRTKFPRFSEFFSITFEAYDNAEDSHTFEYSVGKFFDYDGYFDEEAFRTVVEKELKIFEDGKGKKPEKEE